jgi:hypothetical protein
LLLLFREFLEMCLSPGKTPKILQLETDGNRLTQPRETAQACPANFTSVNNHRAQDVSASDAPKVTSCLRPSKSVGLDGIPAVIIKECSGILIPVR